ncbi:TetR/AcrR family transcriptional regulator [Kribbella sp. NPDC050470]|uniref:TetR/AcrR family transcriptional regulator n=1 Tax=unclassified Kribbella TaxID=2644121 RepID=UPI00379BBB60
MPNPSRRSETSRQAILNTALDLVADIGYPKVAIEMIASTAGVGKQTIYRWWPSKGALLFDAFLTLAGTPDGELAALPDTGDLAADLKLVLNATVEDLDNPRYRQTMRALHTEIVHDPALAADYHERLDGPMREVKKDRLRAAQQAGQISKDADLDVAVDLIFGPILNRWLQQTGPLTPEYVDTLVDTVLCGLQPREAAAPAV